MGGTSHTDLEGASQSPPSPQNHLRSQLQSRRPSPRTTRKLEPKMDCSQPTPAPATMPNWHHRGTNDRSDTEPSPQNQRRSHLQSRRPSPRTTRKLEPKMDC